MNLSDLDSKPQLPIGVMMEIFCAVGLRIVQVSPEVMTALIAESTIDHDSDRNRSSDMIT